MDPQAEELLRQFVVPANKNILHHLDRERFYRFACRVHALRLRADAQAVRQYLAKNGFTKEKAENLASLFEELIGFLKYYDNLKDGGSDGTKGSEMPIDSPKCP